jgi:hypothetical protein
MIKGNEERIPHTKLDPENLEPAINYKDLAKTRKKTIAGLKKNNLYLEAQMEVNNQSKK